MAALVVLDGLDLSSQQIKHVADGSVPDDAATWGQVQAFVAGLSWKDEVRVASTSNVSVSAAPSSIDGVTLTSGMRILLKNQTTASQNGIYTFASTGAALTRSTDLDSSAEFNNATVLVTSGTTNIDTAWTQTTPDPTVGTSNIAFVQFGAGGGATYTAGNGLQLASTTFSVKLPGSGVVGLVVDSTGVYIDTAVVTRKYSANVGDGTTTDIPITHALGTRDVVVSLRQAGSPYAVVLTSWDATDTNTVTLHFAVAPTSGQYRVTVQGWRGSRP